MLSFSCFGPSSDTIEGGAYWQALPTAKLKIYTFKELKKATGNFRQDGLLYEGAYGGPMFKGWVDEKTFAPAKWGCGMAVAIQRITSASLQDRTETQSAVAFLKRLPHPNVIKLLGYCLKGKEQLLVYEFMQKGSLDTHIFTDRRGHSSNQPITWDTRLKIAIGAARGLNFLHCAEDKIIYRDLKLSNILLDGNYNAKIVDFGWALLGPTGEEMHVETGVVGTMGYIDPVYLRTGNVNEKSDVYSFGVVLLELLTGLRGYDSGRTKEKQVQLVEWAKPLLPHRINLKTVMDVRMEGQYSIDAAFKAAQLTLKCLGVEPQTRPSMKEVVEALERIDKMKEAPKKSKIGFNQHQVRQIMNNQL